MIIARYIRLDGKKSVILVLFTLFGQIVFSQTKNSIPVYVLNENNNISNSFEKELEIFFTINPDSYYTILSFMANNCDEKKYGCSIIYGDESYLIPENSVRGMLKYMDKIVYLVADSNVVCKFDLFFEKIKDTTLTYYFTDEYEDDAEDFVTFDCGDSYFYWHNLLFNDSVLMKFPTVQPIKKYELSNLPKKRWFPFSKKIKVPIKQIKLKQEFDKQQLVYFMYEINKGVPVSFYSFYSNEAKNTDKLVNLIIENFKNSKKLENEKYLGKAYTTNKYLIVDYTYLCYIWSYVFYN